MASSKPKRRRVRVIILIILGRALTLLDNDQSTTATDAIHSDLCAALTCVDSANADDSNWTEEENDVWANVEEVEAALTPNATSPSLSSAASDLHNAIIAWKNYAMPADKEDRFFEALHGDLKELNAKVQRVGNVLSEMKGERIGGRLEKMETKAQEFADFKSKIVGALVIINSIWGIAAAYIIYQLTK